MKAFAARLWVALILLALGAAPASAENRWLRAETTHFIIYGEVRESRVREAALLLERFDSTLRELWQVGPAAHPNKLEVYLLRSQSRLRIVSPDIGDGIAEFYTPALEATAAFAIYNENFDIWAQEILFHEYAHHFMFQNFSAVFPSWVVEGFAEFVQTITFERDQAIYGSFSMVRSYDIVAAQWPPIEQFLRSDIRELSDLMRYRFYAESWAAIHYIYQDRDRIARFTRYLGALAGGADPVEAFEPAFGITPQAFEDALHRYARAGIARGAIYMPEPGISVEMTSLPEAANSLLLPLARLRSAAFRDGDASDDEARALATEIAQIAANYPGDAFAERARIRAMMLRGAMAEARATLEPLLESAPEDYELNYLIGQTYLQEAIASPEQGRAPAAAARRYFARAFRANESHVPTLYGYAQTFMFGEPMPDSAVDVLVTAHTLAPQVDEVAMTTALVLMRRQRFVEAAHILRRLAYEPHGGDRAKAAQQLLQLALRSELPGGASDTQFLPE